MQFKDDRIIEAYVGEYASGKSENAVNRALAIRGQGLSVTLVDLDTVEPCYTMRPIKAQLEALGINVDAWEPQAVMGLGETGGLMKSSMRWALKRPGNIILDIGYGVHGAAIFNLIEGAFDNPWLKIIAVVNMSRPVTATVNDVVNYVRSLGRVDALLNNTHLAEETTVRLVQTGALRVREAGEKLGLPLIATAAVTPIAEQIGKVDCVGSPVRKLERFMTNALW